MKASNHFLSYECILQPYGGAAARGAVAVNAKRTAILAAIGVCLSCVMASAANSQVANPAPHREGGISAPGQNTAGTQDKSHLCVAEVSTASPSPQSSKMLTVTRSIAAALQSGTTTSSSGRKECCKS